MSKLEAARQKRELRKLQGHTSLTNFAGSFKNVGSHASTNQQSIASISSKEDQKLGDSNLINQISGCIVDDHDNDQEDDDISGGNLNLQMHQQLVNRDKGGRASV